MTTPELFDFDTPVDRRHTASMKWEKYGSRDIIPMWVADMDFRSPAPILKAIENRTAHGVFGYTLPPRELEDLIVSMLMKRYQWEINRKWLVWLPGLVTGINVACRAIGEDGDDVATTIPVYPHFLTAPGFNRRNLVRIPMKEDGGRWEFDFDRFEQLITDRTRMFILCNPYNPVGRVFSRDELAQLVAICNQNDIVICSDEIHCDLILDKDKFHIPTAMLDSETADRTITLMAPSKTFNIPGLGCAFAVISNEKLRKQFISAMKEIVPRPNVLGFAATMAAFSECAEWQAALLNYLRGNLATISAALKQMAPLSISPIEATYLAWIDMRSTGLDDPVKFFEDAGVGLQDGIEFDGPGFARMNFGCPRSVLEKALGRMKAAMDNR